MLGYRFSPQSDNNPNLCLIWIHGFLGSSKEWLNIIATLPDYSHLVIDLPGHGESATVKVTGFKELDQQFCHLIKSLNVQEYVLIGYSLGGRIAMYHACHSDNKGLRALVVEGGHPGLDSVQEKEQRITHDNHWINRFKQESIEVVLQDWYQQAVFNELNNSERIQLINDRRTNSGNDIAHMLEVTSLGCQPALAEQLIGNINQQKFSFCYLCGEYDNKFQQVAKEKHLPYRIVAKAGHNAHRANPTEFTQQLISFLKEC